MADLLGSKMVRTRVYHRCFGCGRIFPAGSEMNRERCADGGTAYTLYLCTSCMEVSRRSPDDDGFCEGDLLDDVLEYEAEKSCAEGEATMGKIKKIEQEVEEDGCQQSETR